ncbi:MAG: hypothetical protein CME61_05130 [Halobacteriovoraceae bacterium]|nr:hypothetical protein [Halobacteriovoraceae bacterium]
MTSDISAIAMIPSNFIWELNSKGESLDLHQYGRDNLKSGYKIKNWDFDPDPKLGLTNMKSLHGMGEDIFISGYTFQTDFACGSVEGVSANGFIKKVDPLFEKNQNLCFEDNSSKASETLINYKKNTGLSGPFQHDFFKVED